MPDVSVCIPAYCAPGFLATTVRSVLRQDFEDFELVVTDDSPDSSVEDVVRELDDPRIRYSRNERRLGSPANWVAAIERSSAPLVKLLHHDDCFTSDDSLCRFVRLLDDPDVDLGFSASLVVDAEGSPVRTHQPLERIAALRRDPRTLLRGNWIGAPSATIYRRSSTARIDLGLRWLVDIDLYLSILSTNPRFAYEPDPLVATTSGAMHQVTTEIESNPVEGLREWFLLVEKWEPGAWSDLGLLRHLARLQWEAGTPAGIGLSGRASLLYALARAAGAVDAVSRAIRR